MTWAVLNCLCLHGEGCDCGGVHVVPLNDLRDHVLRRSCWCSPDTPDEDTVVHNALDERDKYETGELKAH